MRNYFSKTKYKKSRVDKKLSFNFLYAESGMAMMVSVIFFVAIAVIAVIGLTGPSARDYRMANDSVLSRQSYYLAESGTEDVYYRMKNSKHVDQTETLVLGSYSTVTSMNFLGSGNVDISSIGNVSSHERAVDLKVSGQNNFVFSYAVQTGAGGLTMGNNGSVINGDVYSYGPISATSSSAINGNVFSPSLDLFIDQSNDSGSVPYDTLFSNAGSSKNIYQSFQVSQNIPLSKISLYVKKIGSPSDLVVNIVDNIDSTDMPGTNILATGTLPSSSVGGSYTWTDVVFSQKQMLSVGRTYWFVVVGNVSSTDYYTIATTGDTYLNGNAKIGQVPSYFANPVSVSADYFFRIYLGGLTGSVNATIGTLSIGNDSGLYNVSANSVSNVNATGNIYCNTGLGNNKTCLPYSNLSYSGNPISDSDILRWKAIAASGTNFSTTNMGSFPVTSTSSRKYNGNLLIPGGQFDMQNYVLWVTGDLTINTSGYIKFSTEGSDCGIIIVDGKINFNGAQVRGSDTAGSHVLVVSTNNSQSDTSPAINANSSGVEPAILYAPYGLVKISGSTVVNQVTGYSVNVSPNSLMTNVNYDPLISSLKVTSSSTSSAYNISSWSQTQ